MSDTTLMIMMIAILLLALFVIPQFLGRQAINAVIRIFREHGAIGINSAQTAEKLGLAPKPLLQRMLGRRDYKPQALEILLRNNIIKITEDGKLYLSEENLAASKLK